MENECIFLIRRDAGSGDWHPPGGVRSRMARSSKYSAGTLWLCVVVSPCSLQHVECEAQFMEGGTEMIFRHILA